MKKFRPIVVICNGSRCVYILRGVQRRYVWAAGQLGVAAWLACVAAAAAAAAVDRQARQSCRVWRGGVS